jgi:uncharacterized protein with beta-barrel porin domain
MGEAGNAVLGGSLGTMSLYATQTYSKPGIGSSPYSAFAYGAYDSDPSASGMLGVTRDLPNAMLAGVVVGAHYVNTDMVFDGSAKFSGGSAGAFLARVPDAGLQWFVGIGGITLAGDADRGYLNGSGQAHSDGHTSANGYGGIARLGWSFNNLMPALKVTPFGSYTITTVHFDGYTETGGVFPAQFNGFNDTPQISRLGADARYTIAQGAWVWGTAAWAHRFDSGNGTVITGSLIGLLDLTATGASVMRDWLELTTGARVPIWKNAAVTGSLIASVPANYATTCKVLFGLTQSF